MRTFADSNPIAVTVYFLTVSAIAMFCANPVISAISLFGAVILYIMNNGRKGLSTHIFSAVLFAAMSLVNPLVSHNGATVLFVMNNNPVTLEALVYGISAAVTVIAVLYWFRSFSQIMTSDKLLYLFGTLSPKLALTLSMALRYVPLFGAQIKKIHASQKALGLYKDDNIVDSFRGGMGIFSIMLTWALENGVVTADSMTARGYGAGLARKLRRAGKSVQMDMMGRNFKNQFKYANKIKAKNTIIIGEDEVKTGSFSVKNMATGEQTSVSADEIDKL